MLLLNCAGDPDDNDDFIDDRSEAEIRREGRERLAAEGREELIDGQYEDSDADDQDPAAAAGSGSGDDGSGSSDGEDGESGSDLEAAAAAEAGGSQISDEPLGEDEQREAEMLMKRWEPGALFEWFMRCLLELQLAYDAGDNEKIKVSRVVKLLIEAYTCQPGSQPARQPASQPLSAEMLCLW